MLRCCKGIVYFVKHATTATSDNSTFLHGDPGQDALDDKYAFHYGEEDAGDQDLPLVLLSVLPLQPAVFDGQHVWRHVC